MQQLPRRLSRLSPHARSRTQKGLDRVSTDKVDAIINLVGELVITQSMLNCFGESFDMSMQDKLRDECRVAWLAAARVAGNRAKDPDAPDQFFV